MVPMCRRLGIGRQVGTDKRREWIAFFSDQATNTEHTIYRIDLDAIVIIEMSPKKTGKMRKKTIDICKNKD